ncbi:hypothetical protein [Chryseobacterium sp. R2A-55]|nr:hypothetical protein [Chryseobacterium sp. R2A-55]
MSAVEVTVQNSSGVKNQKQKIEYLYTIKITTAKAAEHEAT